jgi:hypothetical protein
LLGALAEQKIPRKPWARLSEMKQAAVDAATASLDRISRSIETMRAAGNFQSFEDAWSDLLMAAAKIYTKLEQGSKTGGPSAPWFGHKLHQRKNDPLLRYIRAARDIDYHGLEKVTERVPGSTKIGGDFQLDGVINSAGPGTDLRVTPIGGVAPFVEISPARSQLVDIVHRDGMIPTPKQPDGSALSPLEAAEATRRYMTDMVQEALGLVVR